MPKRKRDDTPAIDTLFFKHRTDLFHALKTAKGYERQRQSKRLSDKKTPPEKKGRIENEIVVLKSLDLQQTAHAHLCSSLLKVKAVAESPKLPAEIKQGVPKPELTEEERAALHNVTSSLYNRAEVRKVVEKAVKEVCKALGVEVGKKGKGKEKDEVGEKGLKEKGKKGGEEEKKRLKEDNKKAKSKAGDAVESGKAKKKKLIREASSEDGSDEDEELDEEMEEKALSELDKLYGLESDKEDDSEEEETFIKGRARRPTSGEELDPMEITTDEENGDDEDDDDDDDELDPMEVTSDEEDEEEEAGGSGEFNGFSDMDEGEQSSASDDEEDSDAEGSDSSGSSSPPVKKSKRSTVPLKPTDSTFLPSLMGGYISGSESASDVDVAPADRKNRRGQRARQAIWEKKFGEKAKHLQQPAKGRDAGWDLKRGAVEGGPWKRGIRNPLLEKSRRAGKDSGANDPISGPPLPKKERVRDDSGPLHPSWEAKRLAKEKMQTAPFQGKKITFD